MFYILDSVTSSLQSGPLYAHQENISQVPDLLGELASILMAVTCGNLNESNGLFVGLLVVRKMQWNIVHLELTQRPRNDCYRVMTNQFRVGVAVWNPCTATDSVAEFTIPSSCRVRIMAGLNRGVHLIERDVILVRRESVSLSQMRYAINISTISSHALQLLTQLRI